MKAKNCSFKALIKPYALIKPVNWNKVFHRCAPLEVEIGFGMGENLMRMAQQMPERNFVGIEQNWERICKTLKAITRKQADGSASFENIKILTIDARTVFKRFFPEQSIDNIYCLFPCPWPKKKHIKHRLFSNTFLRLLNSRLKKKGALTIVTDFYPYFEWMLEQIERTGLKAKTKRIRSQYNTKFERKWREEGQEEFFELNLSKTKHLKVPLERDVDLKRYTLTDFHVDRLRLKDDRKDACVLFKDIISDEKRKRILIRALVVEEELTQHFWITIEKKQKKWHLAKTEGQNFFPTPGIAKALDLVYQAAQETTQ